MGKERKNIENVRAGEEKVGNIYKKLPCEESKAIRRIQKIENDYKTHPKGSLFPVLITFSSSAINSWPCFLSANVLPRLGWVKRMKKMKNTEEQRSPNRTSRSKRSQKSEKEGKGRKTTEKQWKSKGREEQLGKIYRKMLKS